VRYLESNFTNFETPHPVVSEPKCEYKSQTSVFTGMKNMKIPWIW